MTAGSTQIRAFTELQKRLETRRSVNSIDLVHDYDIIELLGEEMRLTYSHTLDTYPRLWKDRQEQRRGRKRERERGIDRDMETTEAVDSQHNATVSYETHKRNPHTQHKMGNDLLFFITYIFYYIYIYIHIYIFVYIYIYVSFCARVANIASCNVCKISGIVIVSILLLPYINV